MLHTWLWPRSIQAAVSRQRKTVTTFNVFAGLTKSKFCYTLFLLTFISQNGSREALNFIVNYLIRLLKGLPHRLLIITSQPQKSKLLLGILLRRRVNTFPSLPSSLKRSTCLLDRDSHLCTLAKGS